MTILSSLLYSIVCEFCKSKDVVKAGFRNNKSGKKQRNRCNNCKRLFVVDDGFKKMKHNSSIIFEAFDSYKKGMPIKDIKKNLEEHKNIKISRKTIFMWIKKYSKIL